MDFHKVYCTCKRISFHNESVVTKFRKDGTLDEDIYLQAIIVVCLLTHFFTKLRCKLTCSMSYRFDVEISFLGNSIKLTILKDWFIAYKFVFLQHMQVLCPINGEQLSPFWIFIVLTVCIASFLIKFLQYFTQHILC